MLHRRGLLSLLGGMGAALLLPGRAFAGEAERTTAGAFEALEKSAGGRLGVALLDTRTRQTVAWRGDERFGLCSTFKLPLAAMALAAADRGAMDLEKPVPFGPADILPHSPVTEVAVGSGGLPAGQLIEAAVGVSDNTAANLLLKALGGPAALTQWLRANGDKVTRLDANEPALNLVLPGTVENTTSPLAMAQTTARFFADGGPLKSFSSGQLGRWLQDSTTGTKRLRAGIPASWPIGDKTGTGIDDRTGVTAPMANKANDVAVIWRANGAQFIIAAYYDAPGHFPDARPEDDAVLAQVGHIAANWMKDRI